MRSNCAQFVLAAAAFLSAHHRVLAHDDLPPNTQEELIPFTTPEESLHLWKLPEGFRASLFASEPMVRQPISMAFDERGRLWVAECDSYSDREENFSDNVTDRIVVFTDQDGDGKADERKVFWDKGRRLTSVLPGLGGIWALDAPRLLFFPDADRDDVPDGPPQVLLDGFDDDGVRHNIVNGLLWGPDGWIYGRHGILVTSRVGAPGTPDHLRTPINCGIWRFHPTQKKFEVVAHGTTNPWGMDFNEHGEMFMINTVIGHLWHVVPGAHFQRMYGSDFDPYLYRLLPQTADHFHWDTKEAWSDIRTIGVSETTDAAGGGHAHCGLMIYQGDNWPEQYRGKLFTVNLHGRRLNCERLDRVGCGYVGKHEPDMISTTDPWFRGIELVYGPDGGVYLADWSDIGECHDNDGIHRTSGRIFKFIHGTADGGKNPAVVDLRAESDENLVAKLSTANEWFVRQARLQLQERSLQRKNDWSVPKLVEDLYRTTESSRIRIAALLTLHCIDATPPAWLAAELQRNDLTDEHTRAWLVRLMTDSGDERAAGSLKHAAADPSGLVRLYVASGLGKLPAEARFDVANALAQHAEDAEDPWQPLMIWYGVHEAIPSYPAQAVALAGASKIPLVREFVIRRVTQSGASGRNAVVALLSQMDQGGRLSILQGMVEGLRGVRRTDPPQGWDQFATSAKKQDTPETTQLVRELGAVFGDGRALDDLKKIATDSTVDSITRSSSIDSLVEARVADVTPLLSGLLNDREVAGAAVRGLAVLEPPAAPEQMLAAFPNMPANVRFEVVVALASRPAWAETLVNAIVDGRITRDEVPPFQVRQMLTFGTPSLTEQVRKLWPDLEQSGDDLKARIAELQSHLTEERLAKANLPHGRAIFDQNCGKCHKLFGEGGTTAPDLTGAQRSNINYLLENIVDPSLTVAASYRMSVLVTVDGRILNGVVSDRTEKSLQLQTPTERMTIPIDEIEEIRDTNLSLMPAGQLDVLPEDDIRDLIGYLMSPVQVRKAE